MSQMLNVSFKCWSFFVWETRRKKGLKTIQTLSYWYSFESSFSELSDEYPCARVHIIFASDCFDQISHQLQRVNPYTAVCKFGHYKMVQKNFKNNWNPGKWVLIWEYSARAFQWIPTWQGFAGFWKSLHPCALDENIASALEGIIIIHQSVLLVTNPDLISHLYA